MNGKPLVTVFLPTLNDQLYLIEALESLRAQTFKDFKLAIVDGGSTDATAEICGIFCGLDPRITFSERKGTTFPERFNEALAACETEYMAIAHSHDVQHPQRLGRQVSRMNRFTDIVLLGADTVYGQDHFHGHWETSNSEIETCPQSHEEIVGQVPFWRCFATPSLILRAPHFRRMKLFADTRYRFSSDYLFYWRAARSGRVENLGQVLRAHRHPMHSNDTVNRPECEEEDRVVRRIIVEESGMAAHLGTEMTELMLTLKIDRNEIADCPASLGQYATLLERIVMFAKKDPAFDATLMRSLADAYLDQLRVLKPIVQEWPERIRAMLKPLSQTAEWICRKS